MRHRVWLVAGLSMAAVACGVTEAWQARRGERLYEAGSYAESYAAFEQALAASGEPALGYNSANALYRMHRYEEASRKFRDVLGSAPKLQQRAFYNMGNAYVRMAEDKPDDPEPLRRAIAAYEEALRLEPGDTAAKWNLELAVKRLGDEPESGGSPGRGNRGESGRGDMNGSQYEGTPEAAVGAMAGGGQGGGGDESVEELNESQARQLLEAVERQQLTTHEGKRAARANAGDQDW